MDPRSFARAALAWLALALGAGLAVMAAWASMRSLYYPGTGAALQTDGALGALLGAGLLVGAGVAYRRLAARGALRLTPARAAAIALPAGGALGLFLAWMAWQVATYSSGWFDGIEYAYLFAGAVGWTLACLLVAALTSRAWNAYFGSVVVTAGAIGTASVIFGLVLLARAPDLQATAAARNARVPGVEVALLLALLAALALARRRAR